METPKTVPGSNFFQKIHCTFPGKLLEKWKNPDSSVFQSNSPSFFCSWLSSICYLGVFCWGKHSRFANSCFPARKLLVKITEQFSSIPSTKYKDFILTPNTLVYIYLPPCSDLQCGKPRLLLLFCLGKSSLEEILTIQNDTVKAVGFSHRQDYPFVEQVQESSSNVWFIYFMCPYDLRTIYALWNYCTLLLFLETASLLDHDLTLTIVGFHLTFSYISDKGQCRLGFTGRIIETVKTNEIWPAKIFRLKRREGVVDRVRKIYIFFSAFRFQIRAQLLWKIYSQKIVTLLFSLEKLLFLKRAKALFKELFKGHLVKL